MMAAVASQAQLPSTENQMISESVKGSLLVMQQSYKVKDRNAELYYGFNGRDEFGHTNTVAVRLKDGLCYTADFVRPWENDANFTRYQAGFVPVYAGAQFKYADDSIMRGFPFDSAGCRRTESALVYTTPKTPFDAQGLERDTVAGNKRGWLLWVVSDDTVRPTDSIQIVVRACNLTATDTVLYHKVNQPKQQLVFSSQPFANILGGVFVTPQHTALGEVRFVLTGVMVRNGSEWQVATPFIRQSHRPAAAAPGLTPIQNPSQSQKQKPKKR